MAEGLFDPGLVQDVGPTNAYDRLFTLLKEWGHGDLVLDRTLGSPFHAELASLDAEKAVARINPRRIAASPHACPVLARLTPERLALLDASIALGLRQNRNPVQPARSVGGWLFSREVPVQRIAGHLERVLVAGIRGAPDALLRFWDPRATGFLSRILTPEQIAVLMGPVELWVWMDRAGHLRSIERPAAVQHEFMMLHLSAEQDAAIDRIESVNTVLKALAGLGKTIDPDRDPEIDALVAAAARKGHVHEADLLAYVLHALLVDADFDAWPEVREAMASAKRQGLGLCRALEQFDDAFWEERQSSTR